MDDGSAFTQAILRALMTPDTNGMQQPIDSDTMLQLLMAHTKAVAQSQTNSLMPTFGLSPLSSLSFKYLNQ